MIQSAQFKLLGMLMPTLYPKEFYYEKLRSGLVYTSRPTGTISIERVLSQNPKCFTTTSLVSDIRQKKLILADWTGTAWSIRKINQVCSELQLLLKDKFEIYLWQSTQLVRLSEKSIADLQEYEVRRRMYPYDFNVIDRAAASLRLSKDETHMLDDHWINFLLHKKIKKRGISEVDLLRVFIDKEDIWESLAHFIKRMQASRYKFEVLNINTYDDYESRYEDDFFTKSGIEVNSIAEILNFQFKRIVKYFKEEKNLFPLSLAKEGDFTGLKNMDIELLKNTLQSIPALEVITLKNTEIDEANFISLLYLAAGVTEIDASGIFSISSLPDLPNLNNLEEINLSDTNITTVGLMTLLRNAPKLKKLILKNCSNGFIEITNQEVVTQLNHYHSIQEIDLEGILEISYVQFTYFINLFPNLKRINLSFTGIKYSKDLIDRLALFEMINLKNAENKVIDFTTLDPGSLPNLKELYLGNEEKTETLQNMSLSNLNSLFAAAPNLRIIDLTSLDFGISSEIAMASSLETIVYKNNDPCFLPGLLGSTPNLKKLLVSDFDINFGLIAAGSLPLLSELIIINSCVDNLAALLAAAPNLIGLNVNNSNVSNLSTLKPNSLPHLQFCWGLNKDIWNLSILCLATRNLIIMDAEDENDRSLNRGYNNENYNSDEEDLDLSAAYLDAGGLEAEAEDDAEPEEQAEVEEGGETEEAEEDNTEYLDAKTSLSDREFSVVEIFSPLNGAKEIHPAAYRIKVYQSADINPEVCDITHAFTLKKMGGLDLVPPEFWKGEIDADWDEYKGKQDLNLSNEYEWQALASISPHEKLHTFKVSGAINGIELRYSQRDNLYYVRSKKGESKVTIEFNLCVPKKPIMLSSLSMMDTLEPSSVLPYFFQKLTDDLNYQDGGQGALVFSKPQATLTGTDYLNALIEQKKGACRHRAFIFMYLVKNSTDYSHVPVRLIYNDCHAFVEVQHSGSWVPCDLGGHPASIHITNPRPALVAQEASALSEADLSEYFKNSLRTWERPQELLTDPNEFYSNCVTVKDKKWLVECTSNLEIEALHLGFMNYCRDQMYALYYIHSPEDLCCLSSYLKRNIDDSGTFIEGPSGPLHDFLQSHTARDKVLLINYANFKSADLAKANSLLDESRIADGTPINIDVVIIGLINSNNSDTPPGADFYSRFGSNRGACPLSSNTLFMQDLKTLIPSSSLDRAGGVALSQVSIDLYKSPDWKEILLGKWAPDGSGWHYNLGELQKALELGKTVIEIINGPWGDSEFCRFWREILVLKRIDYAQRIINVPEGFSVCRREGYDWGHLRERFALLHESQGLAHSLNPAFLSDFFTHYTVNSSKLVRVLGLIEQKSREKTSGAELKVYLTQALSEDNWARVLTECSDKKVVLKVYPSPGVSLPEFLFTGRRSEGVSLSEAARSTSIPELKSFNLTTEPTQLICSSDADLTVAYLVCTHTKALIIDVTECEYSDLIERITIENTASGFNFTQQTSAVVKALTEGKTVILKGIFLEDLRCGLDNFLLKRTSSDEVLGCLILISDDSTLFPYIAQRMRHEVSYAVDQTQLKDFPQLPYRENESFAQMKARLSYIQKHPTRADNTDAAWEGFTVLDSSSKDPGVQSSSAEAKAFHSNRIEGVINALKIQPYVFLTGLSGVGKTTFVTDVLIKQFDATLYQGESMLAQWAIDTSPDKQKILFIDEANLNPNEWTVFEGLFNPEPAVLINGEYHVLSTNHKVVFAGNPVNFGGDRKLASFFERHGNALVFEPLSSSVLYYDVLEPVFKGTTLETVSKELIEHLLEINRFLCLNSDTELLISPRELKMMALLTISTCMNNTSYKPLDVVKHFGHQIAQSLVPSKLVPQFIKKFPDVSVRAGSSLAIEDFYITPSREPVVDLLNEFLLLRENRSRPVLGSPERSSGGLGGIIIEGEPGIGKSEMVIALLKTRGYVDGDKRGAWPYYHLPASAPIPEKLRILCKAFHEGVVVVMDEINCSPALENCLNNLLSGKDSETFKSAKKAGFMIIGTQNPISMAGRTSISTALNRRLMTVKLPEYTQEEIASILENKGLETALAKELAHAYEEQKSYAERMSLTPVPTFRDVLSVAKKELEKKGAIPSFAHKKLRTSSNDDSFSLPIVYSEDEDAEVRYKKREIKVRNRFYATQEVVPFEGPCDDKDDPDEDDDLHRFSLD